MSEPVRMIYSQRDRKIFAAKLDDTGAVTCRYRIRSTVPDALEQAVKIFADGLPVQKVHRLPWRLRRAR